MHSVHRLGVQLPLLGLQAAGGHGHEQPVGAPLQAPVERLQRVVVEQPQGGVG